MTSTQRFFHARFFRAFVLCSLVGVGLLVAGCDSSGSNGGNNPWTGQWELIEASNVDLSQSDFFYDITSESITVVFENDALGCQSSTLDITEIDGNVITVEEENGETDSGSLEVQDNDNLLIKDIGSTESATAEPADTVPSCN